MSKYGLQKTLDMPFASAVEHVTAALKEEGFGVLTEIDFQATLKKKLDVDMPEYVMLGACNPGLAHQALQQEKEIGLLLPCNVIVYTDGAADKTHIAILDPATMVSVTENNALDGVATDARTRLARVIETL